MTFESTTQLVLNAHGARQIVGVANLNSWRMRRKTRPYCITCTVILYTSSNNARLVGMEYVILEGMQCVLLIANMLVTYMYAV